MSLAPAQGSAGMPIRPQGGGAPLLSVALERASARARRANLFASRPDPLRDGKFENGRGVGGGQARGVVARGCAATSMVKAAALEAFVVAASVIAGGPLTAAVMRRHPRSRL